MTIPGVEQMLQPNLQGVIDVNSTVEGPAFLDIFRDILKTDSMNTMRRFPGMAVSHKPPETGTTVPTEKSIETGSKAAQAPLGKAASRLSIKQQLARSNLEGKKPVDKELLSACRDMEALFTGIMLKSMRETIHENNFFGKSIAKDIFSDMLYDEYAKLMAKTDQIGLARQIYDQLSE